MLRIIDKPEEIVCLTNSKANEIKLEISGYNIKVARTKISTPKKKNDKATLVVQALIYLEESNITE